MSSRIRYWISLVTLTCAASIPSSAEHWSRATTWCCLLFGPLDRQPRCPDHRRLVAQRLPAQFFPLLAGVARGLGCGVGRLGEPRPSRSHSLADCRSGRIDAQQTNRRGAIEVDDQSHPLGGGSDLESEFRHRLPQLD